MLNFGIPNEGDESRCVGVQRLDNKDEEDMASNKPRNKEPSEGRVTTNHGESKIAGHFGKLFRASLSMVCKTE